MEKEWLYLLLTLEGLAILLLLATILYYRRELFRCRLRLVRFIHANLEMKEKLPYSELPHCLRASELTAEEFYSIVKNLMKRFLFIASFLLLFLTSYELQVTSYDTRKIPDTNIPILYINKSKT